MEYTVLLSRRRHSHAKLAVMVIVTRKSSYKVESIGNKLKQREERTMAPRLNAKVEGCY